MLVKFLISGGTTRRFGVIAVFLLLAVLVMVNPRQARADTEFEWAGFGTIGAGVLDDDSINETNWVPHNLYDEDLQFDVDSRLGFQGTAFFNERFSAALQVVANSAEDDEIQLEWVYASYEVNQHLKLRVGHLRRPLYALSDVLPVGYVYPWARPPVEVYSNDLRAYDGQDAIDLFYQAAAGQWNLTTQVYYGGSSGEADIGLDEKGDFNSKNDLGIILEMQKDWLSLRFGYHCLPDFDVESSTDLIVLHDGLEMAGFGDVANAMETEDMEVEFFSISSGIDYQDWLFNAEIIHVPVKGGLAPDENSWYVMGGRRFGPWTVHLTYAEREREGDFDFSQPIHDQAAIVGAPGNAGLLALAGGVDTAVETLSIDQNSFTLGVRYDFEEPISIKAEYQYIEDNQFDLSNNLLSVVVDFLF